MPKRYPAPFARWQLSALCRKNLVCVVSALVAAITLCLQPALNSGVGGLNAVAQERVLLSGAEPADHPEAETVAIPEIFTLRSSILECTAGTLVLSASPMHGRSLFEITGPGLGFASTCAVVPSEPFVKRADDLWLLSAVPGDQERRHMLSAISDCAAGTSVRLKPLTGEIWNIIGAAAADGDCFVAPKVTLRIHHDQLRLAPQGQALHRRLWGMRKNEYAEICNKKPFCKGKDIYCRPDWGTADGSFVSSVNKCLYEQESQNIGDLCFVGNECVKGLYCKKPKRSRKSKALLNGECAEGPEPFIPEESPDEPAAAAPPVTTAPAAASPAQTKPAQTAPVATTAVQVPQHPQPVQATQTQPPRPSMKAKAESDVAPLAATAPATAEPVQMTLKYISTTQTGESVAFDDADRQFDCDMIGTLCADHICCDNINLRLLPTEKITRARFTKTPEKGGALDPICVGKKDESSQLRYVLAQATKGGALSLLELKGWTFQRKYESLECDLKATCKEGKKDCDENLRNCLGRVNHGPNENLMRYPSTRVATNSFQFGIDHGCDGQQLIDGQLCESSAVLCLPPARMASSMAQAVLKCGDRIFSRPLFKHRGAWCVNEYQNKAGVSIKISENRDHLTLEQMLIEEVGPKTAAILLRDRFKPKVKSFWHWGDARTALEYLLPREAFRNVQEYTRWDKHFQDLPQPSKARETFQKYRKCTFGDMDPLKNCEGKLVTPWDLLQDAWDEKALVQSNGVPTLGTDNAKAVNETQTPPKQHKMSKAKPNITMYVFIVVLNVLIFAH